MIKQLLLEQGKKFSSARSDDCFNRYGRFISGPISMGIGSEAQKPLVIVMIGALVSATVLVLLILPIIYYMVYAPRHRMD